MASDSVDLDALIEGRPFRGIQVRVAVLCGLVAVLDGVDTQSLSIAAPALAQNFGMKVTEFGPVFAITLVGGVIGALVCGSLSDKFGRKRVLTAATLAFAVFTVATAFSGTLQQLLAARFLAGLGLGGAVPCFLALSSEYAPPRRRGTLASLLWACFPLGGMLGGFVNAYLISHYGWQMMFYVGGVLPMLVACAILLGLPESPAFLAAGDGRSERLRRLAERIGGQAFAPGTRFYTPERKVAGLAVRHLLGRGKTVSTLLLWLCFAMGFGLLGLVVSWTSAVLQGAGLALAATATVLGFHGLGALFGMGSAGRLIDRFGARRTLVPAFLAAAVATWFMGSVTTVAQASLVMALIGLSLGCGASGMIALASNIYPTTMRATGIGWGMGMGRVAQVIGPLLTGALMVRGLAPGHLMQWLAAMPVVAAIAVWLLPADLQTRGLPGLAPAEADPVRAMRETA